MSRARRSRINAQVLVDFFQRSLTVLGLARKYGMKRIEVEDLIRRAKKLVTTPTDFSRETLR